MSTTTKKATIGSVAQQAIKDGLNNEEALAAVIKKFPDADTKVSSINWYRNRMRRENSRVPSARDLKARAKKKSPKK